MKGEINGGSQSQSQSYFGLLLRVPRVTHLFRRVIVSRFIIDNRVDDRKCNSCRLCSAVVERKLRPTTAHIRQLRKAASIAYICINLGTNLPSTGCSRVINCTCVSGCGRMGLEKCAVYWIEASRLFLQHVRWHCTRSIPCYKSK